MHVLKESHKLDLAGALEAKATEHESISRGNAVDLAGALEAKEREHEAAMHVLKESHKLDLAGALEAKEIELEAAVHALREAHKLALAAVKIEALPMAVDKVKQTEISTKPTDETKVEEEAEEVEEEAEEPSLPRRWLRTLVSSWGGVRNTRLEDDRNDPDEAEGESSTGSEPSAM